MRGLSKNVILSCIALGGVGFASVSQAQPTQMGGPLLLEFAITSVPGNSKICGGYDTARKTLMVDHCDKIKTRGDTGLGYFNDATIRSTLTGECLTREENIHTEPVFKPCSGAGVDPVLQRFVFATKIRQDGTEWPALAPNGGSVSEVDLKNACLITDYPHSKNEVGPSGVYLWACHDSWEYSPNKAIVKQPLLSSRDSQQAMVLEFGIAGICGGYDAARKKMTVERCDKIVGVLERTLIYSPNDATITSVADGLCLTRELPTQTEATFSTCTAGNEYQRFAFESKRDGWPALVPTKGPVGGTVTSLGDSCLITDAVAGTDGPFKLYFWACRASWEYTPNKAVKMRSIADCGKGQVEQNATCLDVTRPPQGPALAYQVIRMKLFKGGANTGACAVARYRLLGEWLRADDCTLTESVVAASGSQQRSQSSFTLAVFDKTSAPVVKLMSTIGEGSIQDYDGMCVQAEWDPSRETANARRRHCDDAIDDQKWIQQPVPGYQNTKPNAPGYKRFQFRSVSMPPGKGPRCLDVPTEDGKLLGRLLEVRDCSMPNSATWELE